MHNGMKQRNLSKASLAAKNTNGAWVSSIVSGALGHTILEPGRGMVMVELRNKSRLVPARPESSFPVLADIIRLGKLSC